MNHISAFQIIESGNKIQWDVLITDMMVINNEKQKITSIGRRGGSDLNAMIRYVLKVHKKKMLEIGIQINEHDYTSFSVFNQKLDVYKINPATKRLERTIN